MPLPKLNNPLIAKALKHIEKFPEAYNQNDVASSCDITKKTPCGAIGCFGAWAVLLSHKKQVRQRMANNVMIRLSTARKLIGLTTDEADYLFDSSSSGNPKKNLRIIKTRLKNIYKARKTIGKLIKNNADSFDLTFDAKTTYLDYSNYA